MTLNYLEGIYNRISFCFTRVKSVKMADSKIESCRNLLLKAKEEYQGNNLTVAVNCCSTVIETLHSYIEKLERKSGLTLNPFSCSTSKKFKAKSNASVIVKSGQQSCTDWDPVDSLSIGELTEYITNPPGRVCTEGKFAKAFAIYGEEFSRAVFKVVKGSSVASLESYARWALISLFETFCSNILASGSTPEFHDGPDPVLFCPVHDSTDPRFGNAVYPVTTALSNAVRKFTEDLYVSHLLHSIEMAQCQDDSCFPMCFHTSLFQKQKLLSVATYEGDWLGSDLISHLESCNDQALLYALAYLNRARYYFVSDQHSLCTEDASTVLKVPVELPIAAVVQANLLKAKSLYKAGTLAKKAYQLNTEKSHTWKLQLQYVRQYRTAAVSFAYALELMNENEFNSEMHQCNVELAVCLHEVLAAQRSDCQLKTCCLCWKNCQVLRNSHIFPKFILELLREEIGILVGKELKGPKEVSYKMLCGECEERFCNWGETLFRSLFLEKLLNQPSKRLAICHGQWLYYFFASLVWRVYFLFSYKTTDFSGMLHYLPFFSMRKFLLTGDVQHLVTDCFLYLFVDKDVFDEPLCKKSHYLSFARKGAGCSFDPDESMFVCYFLNCYLVFPVGKTQNAFLMQGSLKQLKFGEGTFVIEADSQRCMPVFLERYLCSTVATEYDTVLASLSHQTYDRITQRRQTSSNTPLPKVIRCLPDKMSVSFNPTSKCGIQLQDGMKVKYPPMDCSLSEEPGGKRYTLYVCGTEEQESDLLALYRVYGPSCDHTYAFQFSITSDYEVDSFAPCKNIRNEQYFRILLNSNPSLQDFLKTIATVVLMTEFPPIEVLFFPEGSGEPFLQPDGNLILPQSFAVLGEPLHFKNMSLWLCDCGDYGAVAVLRLFCEITYDETPPYNYIAAFKFRSEEQKVVSIEPLTYSKHIEETAEYAQVMKCVLDFKTVLCESIKLLQDTAFNASRVVTCLPPNMYGIEFFPIDKPTSTESLVLLNSLGMASDPVFDFHSWLCSYAIKSGQTHCLAVLQKWRVANLHFLVAFLLQPSSSDPMTISSLSTLPGAVFTTVFMKFVNDYCSEDFTQITKNVILSIQAVFKLNSRVRNIFTSTSDPLATGSEVISTTEEELLPPIVCLPPGCSLTADTNTEALELSTDYSVLCAPLKTSMYSVWLCVYKSVHEFVVVKTTTGIKDICSGLVVALDFVAVQTAANRLKFSPFLHLNTDEIDFIEENFFSSENFLNADPSFQVLAACVQVLLSPLYQSHSLQVYLPHDFHLEVAASMELELMLPQPFIAGPISSELKLAGGDTCVTCWLCDESLGLIKVENRSKSHQYITALTFEYSGSTTVSKLELVELPSSGLQFLVQNKLYLEQDSACLIFQMTSLFGSLCHKYIMGEPPRKLC